MQNIRNNIQAVNQNPGKTLQCNQLELVGRTSAPSDSDLVSDNSRFYYNKSTNILYAYINGSFQNLAAAGSSGISGWDSVYGLDKTLDINSDTLTFDLTHATNDGLTLAAGSGATGAVLQFNNSGSGADIQGTSDTWNITKAGAMELQGDLTVGDIVRYGATSNQAMTIDAKGTGTLVLQGTATGTITLTRAVTATASITITGSADTTVFTVSLGDVVVTQGLLSLDDDDTATGNLVIPSSAATSGSPIKVTCDDITSGSALYVDSDNGVSFSGDGGYINLMNGTSSVFKVQRYGATVIAGNNGTTVLTVSAGDVLVSQGSFIIAADDDDSATFSVTNDTATTASPFVFAGAGVFTGNTTSSFLTLTPSGLTTGTAMYLPMAAMTQGKGIYVLANALTTGKAVVIEQDGEALTSGELLTVSNVESGNLAAVTGNIVSVTSSLTETAGIVTANYDLVLFSRTDRQNFAAQYDAQGSVVKILKTQNKVAGTIVDAVIGLEILSVSTGGAVILGDSVKITSVGVNERSLNIVNAATGKDTVLVTASGILTDGLAAVNIVTSGDVATGGANLILTMSGTPNAGARAFEIDAQKDCYAVYIDTDSTTNDAVYITHSGNLASGKAVLHVTDGGLPGGDDRYVLRASFTGTDTNESVIMFADGGGKDVTGLYVDCDPVYSAANLSAQLTLFSDAAGDLPILVQLYHQDAGAVSGEYCAKINFFGSDDAQAKELYASIEVEMDDTTAANPDGILWIRGDLAGTLTDSAGFTGNKVLLGAAAATLTTNGAWNLTISTNDTAGSEPTIVLTDGATGNITVTAGGTSGEIDLASPVMMSSTQSITGAGTINVTTSITELDTGGGGAYTLPDGVEGQIKLVVFKTDSGTDAVITPNNRGGYAKHTMTDAGDSVTFLFTNSVWYIVGQGGLGGGGLTD